MSLVITFCFTSSMLNMFWTLVHPSSGACHFSVVSPRWSSFYCTRIHSIVHGFILLYTDSFYCHGFILLYMDSFSCTQIHSIVHGFILLFTDSFYCTRIHSLVHGFILLYTDSFYCITTLVVCSCFDVCWLCWGGIRLAG